jgi:hypothetical protein
MQTAQPSVYKPDLDEVFRVRFSVPTDLDRILTFQAENSHTWVLARKKEEYKERARHGAAVLVENEQKELVGCSLSYPLSVNDTHHCSRHIWTEMGSTRIILNGYKLYQLMVAATAVQQFLMQPPEDRFVAEVDIPNTAVHRLLGGTVTQGKYDNLGWTPFAQVPPALPTASTGTVDLHDGQPVIWYQCGIEHLPHQARVVKSYIDQPVIERFNKAANGEAPKLAGRIRLDFSQFQLAHLLSNYLASLAGQNLGDPANPNPAIGLLDSRAYILNADLAPSGERLHHSHHHPAKRPVAALG